MKILLTTDTVGGVWTYCMELVRALGPDHPVALATMGAPLGDDQRAQVEQCPHVQVFPGQYKLEWMDDPWDDVRRSGDWLLEIESQFKPDLVHLNGYSHGVVPFLAPTVIVAHSCVLSWWQAVKREPAPGTWDRYRHRVAAGLHGADLVIAPSLTMLSSVNRHYGPLGRTSVIYNGRDGSAYKPARRKEPFVLAAGRLWDEAKNVAALEKVAPDLPWPVRVAGEQKRPDGGQVSVGAVDALGQLGREELAGWFSRASIYALPARYEPFGLSALEAALSGCALVLGDIPSLHEIWDEAATYVAPDDTDALRAALIRLIEDPSLRQAKAAAAMERAKCFTPQRMAQSYLASYQRLIDQRRAADRAAGRSPEPAVVPFEPLNG